MRSYARNRAGLAVFMLVLAAVSYVATGSGWAILAFGVQAALTTWALHDWWCATHRREV